MKTPSRSLERSMAPHGRCLLWAVLFLATVFLGLPPGQAAAQDAVVVEPLAGRRAPAVQAVDGQARFGTARLHATPGQPALPLERIVLVLPPDAECDSVKVRVEDPVFAPVPGDWDVPPAPPPATSAKPGVAMWPAGADIVDGRDLNVYRKDALFPASPVLEVAADSMRQWRLVDVSLTPYRYNPVRKRLEVLVDGRLKVEFTQGILPAVTAGPVDLVDAAVQDEAANFAEMVPAYDIGLSHSPRPSGDRYVIITTSAIQSAATRLDDFVADKEAQGFTVQVVTEGTWGGGTGDVAAENLRAWLQANYAALNIKYVLLIGDPSPATGTVPMKMCYPQDYEPYYEDCPTDFYYAELTGDWDLDDDGRYGEFYGDYGAGGCGTAWEVLVGRIPSYGSMADLDAILTKIVAYRTESAGDAVWRRKALLPMEPSDSSTPGYHLGEAIKNDVITPTGGGWGYHRVYEGDYGLSPAPEATPCTEVTTTNAWNAQHPGAVFWWTHGSATSAADVMDTAHAATLDDGHPAFTFQCSCLNAYPEASSNLTYTLLKKGGICTVSATRVSWYRPGQTSFAGTSTNSGMTYEYAKRLIADEMPAADALQDLKSGIVPGDDVWWMNYLDFNVYGCPAVGLYSYDAGLVIVTDSPLSIGYADEPYSTTLQAIDGQMPYAWSIAAGELPPGLSLDAATGEIGGTPTQAGSYRFTVQVQDAGMVTATQACDLSIRDRLAITTAGSLPPAIVGAPYSSRIDAQGGVTPYSWAVTGAGYAESDPGAGFTGGGTARGWRGDDSSWSYTLPWAFPFYGADRTSVFVCSNGYLDFTSTAADYSNSTDELRAAVRIAPLWDDLTITTEAPAQDGEDIYITEAADHVVIRWRAQTYSGSYPVNVEAVLYRDGRIAFNYGAAHSGLTPTIGVSNGDGVSSTLSSRDGAAALPAAVSSLFTMIDGPPPGLSLDPATGVIAGTPTGAAGDHDFTVQVTDGEQTVEKDFLLTTVVIAPTVSTTTASSITRTGALSGGNVTADGGAAVNARGVCWDTSEDPTTADSHTIDSTGTGVFTSTLSGLSPDTRYHYRAYATNSAGTSYGADLTFATLPDTTAPSSGATVTPAANAAGWNRGAVAVSLSAGDDLTGVASTSYRRAGTTGWTPYTAPFTIAAQGISEWEFTSTDRAGNVETAKSLTVRIDSERPTTKALEASVKRGRGVSLRYRIVDAVSPRARRVVIRIYRRVTVRRTTVYRFRQSIVLYDRPTNTDVARTFRCRFKRGTYRWTVSATDLAGNRQQRASGNLLRVR